MRWGRRATSTGVFLLVGGFLSVFGYLALDTVTEPPLQAGVGSAQLALLTDTPKANVSLATELYPGTNGYNLNSENSARLTITFLVPKGKRMRWILRIYDGTYDVWKRDSEPIEGSHVQISPVRTDLHGQHFIQVTGSASSGDAPVGIYFTSSSNWKFTSGTYVVGNLPTLSNGASDSVDWLPGSWYPSPNMNFSETYFPDSSLNVLSRIPAPAPNDTNSEALKFSSKGNDLIPAFTAQDLGLMAAEKRNTLLGGLALGIAGSSLVAVLQVWQTEPGRQGSGQGGPELLPVPAMPTVRVTRRSGRRGIWLRRVSAALIVMSIVRLLRDRAEVRVKE